MNSTVIQINNVYLGQCRMLIRNIYSEFYCAYVLNRKKITFNWNFVGFICFVMNFILL